MVYIWRNSGRHFMPCRCCIVEILDGNSGFASLRRVCFAGAAYSPWGSLFPAKSDGERNGRNGRRLGRRRANDYHHGTFGQRYAKSRGGNGSGRWFCQSQGNGFCQALSDAPAREGAACPCVGGGAYHWCWIYAGAAG